MRKGQLKLMEDAKKRNFSEEYMKLLSDETYNLKSLHEVYRYLCIEHCKNTSVEIVCYELYEVLELLNYDITGMNYYLFWILLYEYKGLNNKKKQQVLKFARLFVSTTDRFSWISIYAAGLYYEFPKNLAILPIKIIKKLGLTSDYGYSANLRYDYLHDDYLHNGSNSAIILFMRNNTFIYKEDRTCIESLYDYDTHSFETDLLQFISRGECTNAFSRSLYNSYQNKKIWEANPLPGMIEEYCKKHMVKSYDIYSKTIWDDITIKENIEKALEYVSPISTNAERETVTIRISGNGWLNITYHIENKVTAEFKNGEVSITGNCQNLKEFQVTPDGKIFMKNSKGKLYPAPLRDVYTYSKKRVLKNVFDIIFLTTDSLFLKDLHRDMKDVCLIPIVYNEAVTYHNRAELIKCRYKTARKIPIDWNKINLNLSYMIIASLNSVKDEKSRNILLNQREASLIIKVSAYQKKEGKVNDFLGNIILGRIYPELDMSYMTPEQVDTNGIVSDYISMCRQHKIGINLNVKTVAQIRNKHDEAALLRYEQDTGMVKIPKDSVFNPLRKILPKEFEWIKSRKRLIQETCLQKHCVWSYADKITKDKCAIYSFADTTGKYGDDGIPRRYTVEFGKNEKGYYTITQVQGRLNRENTVKMRDYIQEILNKA